MAVLLYRKQGSVTVFLTMIFLLSFSLVGVTYDCTRILASQGYMKVAGNRAAQTVFGNYNRELFQEYGLLGYGGYDGREEEDLNREFLQILEDNLQVLNKKSIVHSSNFYRIKDLRANSKEITYLTEKENFYQQLSVFLKKKAVSKFTDEAWDKIRGLTSETEIQEKLSLTEKYESGEFNKRETGGKEEEKEKNKTKAEHEIQKKEDSAEVIKDTAGGNPLEAFSHMVRDGMLGLLCQDKELSDKEIIARDREETPKNEEKYSETGAANFLKQFLKNGNCLDDMTESSKGKNKMMLLAYCREVFPDYLSEDSDGIQYGLEYLIAGKKEEKSNLSWVVNRLLAVRTLLNFSYVVTNPALQEKSLATATTLAGFTGVPPVITGVQYTILLILSFQEACVDVTALLEGKAVPVIKNASNFKMKYEEICLASKSLFQKKAAGYTKEKVGNGLTISYEEYLTVFLLLEGEDVLRNRAFDIIQQNLREKCNQSFCIDDCICNSTYELLYGMDYVFQELPLLNKTQWGQSIGEQHQEVSYGYKSG